jgi:hypothetical protein
MVRDASFPWTVIIHDVAETQRALLHSGLPTDFISGSSARDARHSVGILTLVRHARFRARFHPDAEGSSILQDAGRITTKPAAGKWNEVPVKNVFGPNPHEDGRIDEGSALLRQ